MHAHPDDAFLVRWLDGEAEADAPAFDHVAACATCQDRLARLTDEASRWRAALALTVDEMTHLRRADLCGRLMAAVAAEGRSDCIQAGVRQLAALLGLTLGIAAAWALLTPWFEPVLTWLGYVIDVPTLTLLFVTQGATPLIGTIIALAEEPTALMLLDLVLLLGLLVAAGLWRSRPQRLGSVAA